MSAESETIQSAKGFARTLEAFSGIAGVRIDFVMRKLAFDALDSVLRRSPVDTGRFRGSWRVSLDTPDLSVDEPIKAAPGSKAKQPAGQGATGNAPAVASLLALNREVKKNRTIIISNNLGYGKYLEQGSSPQAPDGIVEPTFVLMQSRLDAAIAASKREVPDV